ncbi:hypothetical protein F183_A19770 [Bryobacterales bacterium F-183]|nr:hypothetical protein F183_A19770 [Bryobacterales bacterium F-183]
MNDIGSDGKLVMMPCSHSRTEFLYRRDGIEYVRCQECQMVFDAEDLETVAVYDDEEEDMRVAVPVGRRR